MIEDRRITVKPKSVDNYVRRPNNRGCGNDDTSCLLFDHATNIKTYTFWTRLPFSRRQTTLVCVISHAGMTLTLIPWPWCSILT